LETLPQFDCNKNAELVSMSIPYLKKFGVLKLKIESFQVFNYLILMWCENVSFEIEI
jgi:hypothetical protein